MKPRIYASRYLDSIGVSGPPPSVFAFDPGYSPFSLQSHLEQSGHLLCGVKISMSTWQIASKPAVFDKITNIHRAGLLAIAGGGPFEVATALGAIPAYLELCKDTGFDRVEFGEGFAANIKNPDQLIKLATDRGLRVQYELGGKFDGPFCIDDARQFRDKIWKWTSAGVDQIVIEAREDAIHVGLFDSLGTLNRCMADILLECASGNLRFIQFEAPTKKSQFALIEHFGPSVVLANIRLEEILRVEVFRRGLHSMSFAVDTLRPKGPATE